MQANCPDQSEWNFRMCLRSQPIPPVPDETARVARAAFPNGNTYLQLRDELGTFFVDGDVAALYPARGQPAMAPWRLALVTIFQFMEDLSDRQAATAVRARIDWTYALGLELTDPGFDSTVLVEFRARLIAGSAEGRLLETILTRCRERGWLKARGRQRTDATHVRASVRAVTRLACVVEAMRYALNTLATVAPDWLLGHCRPEWTDRYKRRCEESHLPAGPDVRRRFAEQIGRDGSVLLDAIFTPDAPPWLRQLPAVDVLRRVRVQQFYRTADNLTWRTEAEGTPRSDTFISSPFDTDARYATKRSTSWIGYKVHLTETCDDDAPPRITHVVTTAAPTADGEVTPRVHAALREKGLLPAKHLADTAYVDAELLVDSREEFGVDLIGPTRPDDRWQAKAGAGFAAGDFVVDWEKKQAPCPAGKCSSSWTPAVDRGHNDVIKIKFSKRDCQACPSRAACTRAACRTITVRPQDQYVALQTARAREETEEFRAEYARRAGIEGTISPGVRAFGMRRSRSAGAAKTHLQHVATAAAINLVRISSWLMDEPREKTRTSAFAKLMAHALAA
jgi:transposase